MNRLTCGLLLIAFVLVPGCTTCSYRAGDQCLVPESCPEYPADQRAKVYAIIFRGFDPFHLTHVEKLREELNQHGFAKVYCVDFYHEAFIEKEIKRILCEDPDARFVVVGYSLGAGVAQNLVTRVTACSVPVDALVEIAPVYLPFTGTGPDLSRVGRHLIIANSYTQPACHTRAEVLNLSGAGFLTEPSNPVTVQMLRDILMASAEHVPPSSNDAHPTVPLVDNPAPLPGQNFEIPR
ncbi:hypothetical protein [Limnoglobus roseus]|uniref:Uncharacterized protein n=1 Tax=Limnoglobus roseus TaxID=2598579 RepID=A0A5C1ALU2_9BACT|nr:hypothetical protein [Limnoglobus roseus]QEL17878.1 hypothetical protein PX52LOC_04890 [Limnoglobus roseus]